MVRLVKFDVSGKKMPPDLRSDTVTRPCPDMQQAMFEAPVGDDVYGEDPTVNALEAFAAQLLGKEAALFASSGTQTNLIALLAHCGRGDEYIVGQTAHTYLFEGGGAAVLGGIQPQPIDFDVDGRLPISAILAAIKPDDIHFAKTRLVCLENTHDGIPLHNSYIEEVRSLCDAQSLGLHLDGARFFNAVIARDTSPLELARPFDSVSICLSKGLGAPVGSLLLGSRAFIDDARRWRKMLGGGMRQAGVVAAAGQYALEHNVARLGEDHKHAALVADALGARFGAEKLVQHTNMIHLRLPVGIYKSLSQFLKARQIRVGRPRWVFHKDIDLESVQFIAESVREFPVDADQV